MQRAEDGDRFDGRPGEIGRHVVGDDHQPETANFEPLTRCLNCFEVLAGEGPQAQFEGQARSRLLRRVGMGRELVADRRSDEVRAVRIEAVPHQKIDRSQIDESEVDGQLLAVRWLGLLQTSGQFFPSIWML